MFLSVFGEQPLFHRVESRDVILLPVRGDLASEAHHQEREAVARHFIHMVFLTVLRISKWGMLKIQLSKFTTAIKVADL